jgi:ubiquinone/menaquinone biosynthesis C-methylase UbiE
MEAMGVYEEHVLPRFVDVALSGRAFAQMRQRVASGLHGEVLEVGFGSGRNVPYYPDAVKRVLAVDPAVTGRKLAAARVAASPVPVEYVGLDGEQLPLEDASVDSVLTTWTLCTIPAVERALGEIRRVLRPGGALHFVEHGRAPDPRLAGGCHLNRQIDELVAGAGLDLDRLETFFARGPKVFGHMFEGHARRT